MKKFTLLELLIVVSIIAILISLLLPSLSRARKQAISVTCKSNLSQVYKGYYQHSRNGFEVEPGEKKWGIGWQGSHKEYQLLHSISINKRIIERTLKLDSVEELSCQEFLSTSSGASYGVNKEFGKYSQTNPDNRLFFAHLNETSDFILMGCRTSSEGKAFLLNREFHPLANYHPGRSGNVFCADGSVKKTTRLFLENAHNSPSLIEVQDR